MTPQIEVFARPRGNMQWMCPACGWMHSSYQAHWRKATAKCRYHGCEKRYRVGIGLTKTEGSLKSLFMGKFVNNIANRLDAPATYWTGLPNSQFIGHIYGVIDYTCPDCLLTQVGFADFDTGLMTCRECKSSYFVQLLFYAARGKLLVPYDWAVFTKHDKTIPESVSIAASDSRSGEAG